MRFRTSQVVLAVELAVFALGPSTMALFGVPYLLLASFRSQPSGVSAVWWLVPAVLAVCALVALWRIALAFVLKDTPGLMRVGAPWWWLFYMGVALIGAGVLAGLLRRHSGGSAPSDILGIRSDALGGLVMTASMGAKVLVPCAHILFERWRGGRKGQGNAL